MRPNAVFFPEIAITQMRCWLEGRCVSIFLCMYMHLFKATSVCVRASTVLPVSLHPALGVSHPPVCSSKEPQCGAVSQTPQQTPTPPEAPPPTDQCSMTALSSLTSAKLLPRALECLSGLPAVRSAICSRTHTSNRGFLYFITA